VLGFATSTHLELCPRTKLCPDGDEFFVHGNDDNDLP
jgi:hypothetical protein